jgi:hypothetical protein
MKQKNTVRVVTSHLHQRVERLLIVRSSSNLLLSHTSSAALAPLLPPAVYARPADIRMQLTAPACTQVSLTLLDPGAWLPRQLCSRSKPVKWPAAPSANGWQSGGLQQQDHKRRKD